MKLVVESLQEQHPEDELLVFRGVHVASEDIAGFKQLPFQPCQGEPFGFLPDDGDGRGR